ncbi:hypothetical protein [Sphingomonas sp. RS2018]
MNLLRFVGAAAPLLLLSACGSADDSEPSGLTPDEAQDISDAAVMLNDGAVDANAIGVNASARTTR